MNTLKIIGRDKELFSMDLEHLSKTLEKTVSESKFLIIGGLSKVIIYLHMKK